jgi:hypothetical protein
MENLKISLGIAKVCDYYGKKIYQDFLRFDDEQEIYVHSLNGLDEICLDNELEEITDIQETFNIKTVCKENLSHNIICNLKTIPTKEIIIKAIKKDKLNEILQIKRKKRNN